MGDNKAMLAEKYMLQNNLYQSTDLKLRECIITWYWKYQFRLRS